MLHGLVVVLALVALVCLPCVVAVVLTADAIIDSLRYRACVLRRRWIERQLARRAGLGRGLADVLAPERVKPVGPPIEQLAADLRRLSDQRTSLATRSPIWFTAVCTAYDERLTIACQELEITEHLHELSGIDLEIERVRVEGMLTAAGLRLRGNGTPRRQDQR